MTKEITANHGLSFRLTSLKGRTEESLNTMKDYNFYIYIMTSNSGTLYIGVTNNLTKRIYEHKNNLVEGFTKKYGCHKLIYFEQTSDIESAISREKQIKRWNRRKKEALIKTKNPRWEDLYNEL